MNELLINVPDHALGQAAYQSQEMINKYMLMHWGTAPQIFGKVPISESMRPPVVHLPIKCTELILKYATKLEKALDVGCAVGRATFEMARSFNSVTGLDFSQEFIDCANDLKKTKQRSYWRKDTGDSGTTLTCQVDPEIDTDRVSFEHADACALADRHRDYDAVLVSNVLCRLADPQKFLERLQGPRALIKKGGVLVLTTPFSWLPEYTSREKWIQGLTQLKDGLTEYDLVHTEELPFLIREHRRKFEYIITDASVWIKKN
jgi:putative 4-mercaptohistidine N1-methyltranferase